MIFNTRLDTTAKRVTAGTALLFLFNICLLIPALEQGNHLLFYGIVLLLATIYLGTFLFSTRAYELTPQQLIIHRPLKDKIVARADIVEVEILEEGVIKHATRLFGVGGLFGYYGKFSAPKFGTMTWYATNREVPLLLHLKDGRRIFITPEEREAFMAELFLPVKSGRSKILQPA